MTPESTIHKNIKISGRVQGVGFRYAARSVANFYNITGFVRNLPNGDVYIEAEGNYHQLEDFIAWCRRGPPSARIKAVDVTEGEAVGFGEFGVLG
jgi:acylphosphatase